MPVLSSDKIESIDLRTGFYMRATLAFNGLRLTVSNTQGKTVFYSNQYKNLFK